MSDYATWRKGCGCWSDNRSDIAWISINVTICHGQTPYTNVLVTKPPNTYFAIHPDLLI